MEALFSDFTLLSGQALHDKNFDPGTIEDLMKLFEIEAYKAWANLALEGETEVEKAEYSIDEAEEQLESAMESAMAEFHRFEAEMELECQAEYDRLVSVAEGARSLGRNLEKAASVAAMKYIEAAVNSATGSMKSAVRAITTKSKKVHPS